MFLRIAGRWDGIADCLDKLLRHLLRYGQSTMCTTFPSRSCDRFISYRVSNHPTFGLSFLSWFHPRSQTSPDKSFHLVHSFHRFQLNLRRGDQTINGQQPKQRPFEADQNRSRSQTCAARQHHPSPKRWQLQRSKTRCPSTGQGSEDKYKCKHRQKAQPSGEKRHGNFCNGKDNASWQEGCLVAGSTGTTGKDQIRRVGIVQSPSQAKL